MTQPTKTESDDAGRGRLTPDRSWLARAASSAWFGLLVGLLLLGALGVVAATGVADGYRLVVLAWSACVVGALAGRVSVALLRRVGMGCESYLVATVARPLFPLATILVLVVRDSRLSAETLAIVLVPIYLAVLGIDTFTLLRGIGRGQTRQTDVPGNGTSSHPGIAGCSL